MPSTLRLPDHVQHYVEARKAQVDALNAGDDALADDFEDVIVRIFRFFTVADFDTLAALDARGELARFDSPESS